MPGDVVEVRHTGARMPQELLSQNGDWSAGTAVRGSGAEAASHHSSGAQDRSGLGADVLVAYGSVVVVVVVVLPVSSGPGTRAVSGRGRGAFDLTGRYRRWTRIG